MSSGQFPPWFHWLSLVAPWLGIVCALAIAQDVWRRPQEMAVMNVVWPVTALFGTVMTLWAYIRFGRASSRQAVQEAKAAHRPMPADAQPFPALVGKGALHCGAGCMIGDIIAEWLAFAFPATAIALGWHALFQEKMFAVWILDFIFAFCLGVVFQYFAIKPMRGLPPGQAIVAALKADTLSLASWQVGMYGFMAFAQLYWFKHAFGRMAEVDTPEFWFAMQLAMIVGFLTAYPINWWLIRLGIKEKM